MTARARNWLLIVAALVLLVLADRLAPRPELVTSYFDVPAPMAIAHQGGDGLRPGNTLLAFQHAVDLGVDVLELDVHLTRDDAVVVMHDATVDRTTNGSGALVEMTLADVKALDAAYHWPMHNDERPYRGRGVTVPTLGEVVQRHPQLRFNVEIKPDSAAAGRAVCTELTRLQVTDRVLVASFHGETLDAFREACATVPTSGHESEIRRFYLQYRLGLAALASPAMRAMQIPPDAGGRDLSDPAFVAAVRQRGLHVDFWTINDADQMRVLIGRGADGIITDRPDRLLDVLERR